MNKMAIAYFSNVKTLLTLFQVMAAFEGYPESVILDSLEMTLFMVSRILYSTREEEGERRREGGREWVWEMKW